MNKIALVAALILGTASAALAEDFEPSFGNRYPQGGAQSSTCSRAATLG